PGPGGARPGACARAVRARPRLCTRRGRERRAGDRRATHLPARRELPPRATRAARRDEAARRLPVRPGRGRLRPRRAQRGHGGDPRAAAPRRGRRRRSDGRRGRRGRVLVPAPRRRARRPGRGERARGAPRDLIDGFRRPPYARARGDMQRATTVFWDGDTQRDFLEPDGALYVPAAAPIIPNLARLTRLARAGTPRIRVIGTVCRHFPGDAELTPNGGPYPPHCMDGTPGQRKIDATAPVAPRWIENRPYAPGELEDLLRGA